MGLSSLPTPSEGMLTLVLVNTALTISILKSIAFAALRALRLRPVSDPSPDFSTDDSAAGVTFSTEPSPLDRFRSRFKPFRIGRRWAGDCRVCLARFEPESEVDRLPCGHVFHKACIDRWLEYHHVTCPLCRSRLLPPDDSLPSF
ncbi:RING/U-box domain-containing protein [Dioscorea alata]|uniref:RING/U-box domain-containing protein n=1 Tax=Dioscorea alata TaxID=55571 RepID=A0ACB7WM57_DIOAL|nr:RING/U-box domain-containing protein [Dioscorea alata]